MTYEPPTDEQLSRWRQRHRDLQAAIRSEPPEPALPAKSKEME